MARDAQNQAKQTYKQSQDLMTGSSGKANSLYDTLVPSFQNEAANPQGFGQKELSDMTTAAEQSAGGALGAATGRAQQEAAASRNSGSFAPVLDEASRDAGRNLSDTTLGIKNKNALLKESQRQSGLGGLENMFGTENSDVLSSLGLQNQSTNSLVNAGNSGWFQNMLGFMNAASGAGKSAADLGVKV